MRWTCFLPGPGTQTAGRCRWGEGEEQEEEEEEEEEEEGGGGKAGGGGSSVARGPAAWDARGATA